MIETSVIKVMKSFDKQDLKDLKLFLSSPYFNKKEKIFELADYLAKQAPEFNDEKKLNRIYIFKKLFPKEKYNPDKMQRLIAAFTKKVEEFIAYQSLKDKNFLKKMSVLKYYHNASLEDQFLKAEKELIGLEDQEEIKSDVDYLNSYLLSLERFNYLSSNNSLKRGEELNRSSELLERFYLLSRLRLLCHTFNHQNVIRYESDFVTTELILKEAASEQFVKIPLIKAYYHVIMFLRDETQEESFQIVKTLIESGQVSNHVDDEKLLYDFASNYCALRINDGQLIYQQELFSLYQFALEKEILFVNGYLFPNTVKNIVTIALRLEEFDWIEQFLEDYKDKIDPEHREEIYNYNKAHLYFYQLKYDEALDLLDDSNYKDIFYKLAVKILRIKIYCETNEDNLLDSAINAFSAFICRDDLVSDRYIESNRKFINLLKQLRSTSISDKKRFAKLLDKLLETKQIAERNWLREKIMRCLNQ